MLVELHCVQLSIIVPHPPNQPHTIIQASLSASIGAVAGKGSTHLESDAANSKVIFGGEWQRTRKFSRVVS
jgi:hypothetical protein